MNGRRRCDRSRAIHPPSIARAPAVPARVAQEDRSIDLTTSPRLLASSSFRWVGSSVLVD